jgi:hypothetical protein
LSKGITEISRLGCISQKITLGWDKLLTRYNNSVHSTIGTAPSQVNPSNIYAVWKRLNTLRSKILQERVKFQGGDLVQITKENLKFAKGYQQMHSTEIFRVFKVIQRRPQPVYELTDLHSRPIEGQFYIYVLVKVTLSPEAEFKIDKIMCTRNRGGIKQYFVKWKGYDETFSSWCYRQTIQGIIFLETH